MKMELLQMLSVDDKIAIAELLAEEIPNNKLFWIENTGHFPMLENPEGWLNCILKNN